jgi:hypothetical protein
MFLQLTVPNSIANVDTVVTAEVAYKDEASSSMVAQVAFDSNPLVLIKRFDKVKEIMLNPDRSFGIQLDGSQVTSFQAPHDSNYSSASRWTLI